MRPKRVDGGALRRKTAAVLTRSRTQKESRKISTVYITTATAAQGVASFSVSVGGFSFSDCDLWPGCHAPRTRVAALSVGHKPRGGGGGARRCPAQENGRLANDSTQHGHRTAPGLPRLGGLKDFVEGGMKIDTKKKDRQRYTLAANAVFGRCANMRFSYANTQ